MTLVARLIQGAGWLWIAFGIASQIFDFGDIGWFPGIVLVFISRILRTQTARRPIPEQPVEKPSQPVEAISERILNTQRRQQDPVPKTEPGTVTQSVPVSTPYQPPRPEPEPEPTPEPEPPVEIATPVTNDVDTTPSPRKSSEEMIAEARRRWDRQ